MKIDFVIATIPSSILENQSVIIALASVLKKVTIISINARTPFNIFARAACASNPIAWSIVEKNDLIPSQAKRKVDQSMSKKPCQFPRNNSIHAPSIPAMIVIINSKYAVIPSQVKRQTSDIPSHTFLMTSHNCINHALTSLTMATTVVRIPAKSVVNIYINHAIAATTNQTGESKNHTAAAIAPSPVTIVGNNNQRVPTTATSQAIAPATKIIFDASSGFDAIQSVIALITGVIYDIACCNTGISAIPIASLVSAN